MELSDKQKVRCMNIYSILRELEIDIEVKYRKQLDARVKASRGFIRTLNKMIAGDIDLWGRW